MVVFFLYPRNSGSIRITSKSWYNSFIINPALILNLKSKPPTTRCFSMLERAFARVYRVIIQRIASLWTGAAQVAARQLSADPFREVQGFFLPSKGNHPKQGSRPNGFDVLGWAERGKLMIEGQNLGNSKTRWFNVTFLFPSWRSLNLWRGHLIMPKRPRRIAREPQGVDVFFSLSGDSTILKASNWYKRDEILPSLFFWILHPMFGGSCFTPAILDQDGRKWSGSPPSMAHFLSHLEGIPQPDPEGDYPTWCLFYVSQFHWWARLVGEASLLTAPETILSFKKGYSYRFYTINSRVLRKGLPIGSSHDK